jgi:protein-L-isoaspartate(D-aspartate) O-methyltransferase
MNHFELVRNRMVEQQLANIRDERVLEAMRLVPRHCFVPSALESRAYDDKPLPIAKKQTISQPWIVARMTELLKLTGSETVLEVGTGSGYQAAILARVCKRVVSVERHGELAKEAARKLQAMALHNVTVLASDGTMGRSEFAPFGAIMVTAAGPDVPRPLLEQLAPGGRMIIPVGDQNVQTLHRYTRDVDDPSSFCEEHFERCRFVPLLGRYGHQEVG